MCRLHHQGDRNWRASNKVFLRSVLRLLLDANFVHRTPILVTLMNEEIRSSEMLVLIGATLCNIPEDGIVIAVKTSNFKEQKITNTRSQILIK
jgi:hypothetical protein